MLFRKQYLLSLALNFCALSMLIGQGATGEYVGELESVEFESADDSNFPLRNSAEDRSIVFLATAPIEEELYVKHNGDFRLLEFRTLELSRHHYYDGPKTMEIFRKSVNAEGEVIFNAVATAALPTNSQDAIVLLRYLNGQGYRAKVLDMSLTAQALGSVAFYNMTPVPLYVLLGDLREQVSAGDVLLKSLGTDKKYRFDLKIAVSYQGEAQVIFSNRYPFRGAMRMAFIAIPNPSPSAGQSPAVVLIHRDGGPDSLRYSGR